MSNNDLSKVHHLIGNLFQWPRSTDEWKKFALSDQQLDFYNTNGYLSGIKLVDETQMNALREELSQLMDPRHAGHELFYEFNSNESADPDAILFHALGAWRITQGFHDVLWNPRFLMAAYQLLGNKPVRFWHDQLFSKPPQNGGVVAWHQDFSYWTRTTPLAHLTCWCALDDATTENGCLQYVPGSHNWGLLQKPELAGEFMGIIDYLTPAQRSAFQPVTIETKAGEAVFHHPLALHGSGANCSNRPRRAFVVNVCADGVSATTDEPLLQGVPGLGKGVSLEGQFFPLLFEPMGLIL